MPLSKGWDAISGTQNNIQCAGVVGTGNYKSGTQNNINCDGVKGVGYLILEHRITYVMPLPKGWNTIPGTQNDMHYVRFEGAEYYKSGTQNNIHCAEVEGAGYYKSGTQNNIQCTRIKWVGY